MRSTQNHTKKPAHSEAPLRSDSHEIIVIFFLSTLALCLRSPLASPPAPLHSYSERAFWAFRLCLLALLCVVRCNRFGGRACARVRKTLCRRLSLRARVVFRLFYTCHNREQSARARCVRACVAEFQSHDEQRARGFSAAAAQKCARYSLKYIIKKEPQHHTQKKTQTQRAHTHTQKKPNA